MMVAAQFKVDPAEFAGRRVLVTGARASQEISVWGSASCVVSFEPMSVLYLSRWANSRCSPPSSRGCISPRPGFFFRVRWIGAGSGSRVNSAF